MVVPRTPVSPLDWKEAIVDPETGCPTLQFVRLWQQLFGNEEGTNAVATDAVPQSRLINTTAPIVGGGPLSADLTLSHANSGVTANTYGDATHVPQVTVDAKGHVTGVSNVAISGGGGALTLITETSPSGTGVVTFNSIPNTYRDLIVVVRGRGDTAAVSVTPGLTLNNDTGANYGRVRMGTTNGSTTGAAATSGDTSASIGSIPAASATASVAGSIEAIIYDYKGTTFHKELMSVQGGRLGTADSTWNANLFASRWSNTAAVTRVDITLSAGNFVAGSVVSLYGRS